MGCYPPGHILCRPSRTGASHSCIGSPLFDSPNDHDSIYIQTIALNRDAVTGPQTKRFRYRLSECLHVECAGQLFDAPSRRRMIVSKVSSLDPRFASSSLTCLETWMVVLASDMANRKCYNGWGGYNVAIV